MNDILVPVLYAEVNVVCVLFSLVILVKLKAETFSMRLFRAVILSSCALSMIDALWAFEDVLLPIWGVEGNWVVYVSYFFASVPTSFLWYQFSESMLNKRLNKKRVILSAVPMAVLLVLVLASVKTGWIQTVDADGVYHNGPMFWLALILTYGYIAAATGKAFFRAHREKSYAMKQQYRSLALFGFPALIGGALQENFYNLPALCIGISIALFYIFLSLQEQQISTDSLTGLNNYRAFRHHLSERMNRRDKSKLYLMMMDMNDFKSINDTFGHMEGDCALQKIADALRNSCQSKRCFIARFGGDEFTAICDFNDDWEMVAFVDIIRGEVARINADSLYILSVSIGYASCGSDEISDTEFIKQADAALYREKKILKGSR